MEYSRGKIVENRDVNRLCERFWRAAKVSIGGTKINAGSGSMESTY